MTNLTTASIELKLSNSFKHGQREKIIYRAKCPAHETMTSDYQGEDTKGLMFKCKESGTHLSHLFYAKKPRDAPSSVEEVQAWMAKQREKRLNEKESKKRGA